MASTKEPPRKHTKRLPAVTVLVPALAHAMRVAVENVWVVVLNNYHEKPLETTSVSLYRGADVVNSNIIYELFGL